MSRAASTTAESVCCVRRCSYLLFGRPVDTSDTVQLTAFMVISIAVLKLLAQHTASAAACTRTA